jgi:bifunctional UDP-N-acetylglucosamine pyrophosphorylase/glucosamine-1-phosphate N-acetyltransferase
MKAIVLAAGQGVRLEPLTNTRPKHLLPIGGKPIVIHVINALKEAGVKEAVIVVHYLAEKIKQILGDGTDYEMKLNYVEQHELLGTANAILEAEQFVEEDFLLIYGDLLVTADSVKKLMETHLKEKPTATMAIVRVEQPEHYGVVKLEGNYVSDIIEKPRPENAPTNFANAGIYAFSKEILEKSREISKSSRGELELTDSLRLLIKQQKRVLAVQLESHQWLDIGRPWDLLEANKRVIEKIEHSINGKIEDGAHLIGPAVIMEGARIRSGSYIEGPVFIDSESDIGPNCYIRPYTSIGKKVRIGNACEIKNSIIMDGTHIGHLSYVGDSIIGENCNLGAGTIVANLRLDEKTVKTQIKNEIVDSKRTKLGVVLGDNVKTGINTLFMPGVKVGNKSWISAGVIVYRDVPPNSFLLLEQQIKQKEKQ